MEFCTKNLYIRPFVQADEVPMLDLLTDETVKKTYILPDFATRDDAKPLFHRLREMSEDDTRYVAAICLNGVCIGIVNDTRIEDGTVELGYAILPLYHSRGYATEMLRGAITYLFANGYRRVVASAFEENAASLRVMEKCGMKRLPDREELYYRGKIHRCIFCCAINEKAVIDG